MAGCPVSLLATTLVVLGLPPLLHAQTNNRHFHHYAVEEGLTDYAVTSVFQDRTGFLWVGAQGALFRYDGHAFKAFRPAPRDTTALSDGFIYTLEEDLTGNLWIGTRTGGVNKYDPRTERFYHYKHDPTDAHSLSDDRVRAIYADNNGRLWIGTRQGTLNALDPATGYVTRYELPPDDTDASTSRDIFDIYEAPSEPGILWIGRADGLYRFDVATKDFTAYRHDPDDAASLSDNTVYVSFEDRSGTLWIGTSKGGLNRFDRATESFAAYRHDPTRPDSLSNDSISAITQGPDGLLWIGTYGGGLNKFNAQTRHFTHYTHTLDDPNSLSHNVVTALLFDESEQLWAGTYVGLNTYNPLRERIIYYGYERYKANSISHPEVLCLTESHTGFFWIGTNGGGLNRLNRQTGQIRRYFDQDGSAYNQIKTVFEDHQGRLWFSAQSNAFHQFDAETGHLSDSIFLDNASGFNTVQSIYEAPGSPGVLWVGTSHSGLYRYDVRRRNLKRYYNKPDTLTSLSDNYIAQTYQDYQGVLWIATRGGGLNTFDPDSDSFGHYKYDANDTTSISSNNIIALAEDAQHTLWVGTFDRGLNKFDRATGRFTRYDEDNGFPFFDISGILTDDSGFLWLSSSKGLFKLDPKTGVFVNFGPDDGLQGTLFRDRAHYRNTDGELFFGGINGLNIFRPDSVKVNRAVPAIVLTDFLVNNEPPRLDSALSVFKEIQLRHDENVLYFEFAALDYAASPKNQYRYKLDNHDSDWYEAGNQPFARYTNVDPGTYDFRVQGSNNHGIWNTEGATIRIIITPPWWRSWWFYSLITLALLGLVTAAYRYRVARLLEMEHMRIRIASDLHDDLGGKLSGIALMTDLVQRRPTFDETARRRLAQVSDTARHMVDELRDIVWFITPEYDKLDDTLTKMQNVTETLLGEIHYTFYYPDDLNGDGLAMEFRRHFLLCYKEILHNIVRHAQATNVEIRLGQERGCLLLSVADDGVGFDPEAASGGNGLKNIHQRATLMNGTVEIDSRPGAGTTVRITAKTT